MNQSKLTPLILFKDRRSNVGEILFLSDTAEELDAANEAGMKVIQLLGEGGIPSKGYMSVKDFSEIELDKI